MAVGAAIKLHNGGFLSAGKSGFLPAKFVGVASSAMMLRSSCDDDKKAKKTQPRHMLCPHAAAAMHSGQVGVSLFLSLVRSIARSLVRPSASRWWDQQPRWRLPRTGCLLDPPVCCVKGYRRSVCAHASVSVRQDRATVVTSVSWLRCRSRRRRFTASGEAASSCAGQSALCSTSSLADCVFKSARKGAGPAATMMTMRAPIGRANALAIWQCLSARPPS